MLGLYRGSSVEPETNMSARSPSIQFWVRIVRSAHPMHIVEGSDRTIRVERPARGKQPGEVNLPPRQRSEEHGVRGAAAGARGEGPGAKFFLFEISFDHPA